jgi:hypothetical protein
MKAADIVTQLAREVPRYTPDFTDQTGVLGITHMGPTAEVTTAAPHGLIEGQTVAIVGTTTPVYIDAGTFSRIGALATFQTVTDHDLTLSALDRLNGGKVISIAGASEPEFNGTFELAEVPNRRTLIIHVADSGPTAVTGSPLVVEGGVSAYNGVFQALAVTPDTFEIALPWAPDTDPAVTSAKVQTGIRIGAVLDIGLYLRDLYTAEAIGANQLVVQLGDVIKSKNRSELTDAADSTFGNAQHNPVFVQSFAVYIIQNTTNVLDAAGARDTVESEYAPAVLRSLERAQFTTGFTYDYGQVTCTGHGVFAYDDPTQGKNRAIYVHEITFEQLAQATRADVYSEQFSVAMRDVSFTFLADNATLTGSANLDEVPL